MANTLDDLEEAGNSINLDNELKSIKKVNPALAKYLKLQEKAIIALKKVSAQSIAKINTLNAENIALKKVNTALQSTNKANILTAKSSRNLQGSISVMRSEMLILAFALNLVKKSIGGVLESFGEFQNAQKRVANVIRSTGGAAGITTEEVIALAGEYNRLTNVSETLITSSSALLLTFTNIGKDIFPMAQKAVLDMTAAMNNGKISVEGLKSTSIMLGKALNNPIKGLNALSRNGVKFSKTQKLMISRLLLFNDLAGAQDIILKEVNKEFENNSDLHDYNQTIRALSDSFSDLGVQMGGSLRPAIESIAKALTSLAKALNPADIYTFIIGMTAFVVAGKLMVAPLLATIAGTDTLGKSILLSANRLKFWGKTADYAAIRTARLTRSVTLLKSSIGIGAAASVLALLTMGLVKYMKGSKDAKGETSDFTKSLQDLTKVKPEVLKDLNTAGAARELIRYREEIEKVELKISNLGKTNKEYNKLLDSGGGTGSGTFSLTQDAREYINTLLDLEFTHDQLFNALTFGAKNDASKAINNYFDGYKGRNMASFEKFLESHQSGFKGINDDMQKNIKLLKDREKVIPKPGGSNDEADWHGIAQRQEKATKAALFSLNKEEEGSEKLISIKHQLMNATKDGDQATHESLIMMQAYGKELVKLGIFSQDNISITEEFTKATNLIKEKLKARYDAEADLLAANKLPELRKKNMEEWVDMTTEALEGLLETYKGYYSAQLSIQHEAQNLELAGQLTNIDKMKASERVKDKERAKIHNKQKALKIKQHNEDITLKQKEIYVDLGMSIGKIVTAYSRSVGGIFAKWSPFIGGPAIAKAEVAMTKGQLFGQIALATAGAGAQAKSLDKQRMAYGGSFVTSGPQELIVGDNPGGKELVNITPINTPNIGGSPVGTNINISFEGNVLSDDFIISEAIPKIKEAIRRGEDIGI